MASSDYRKVCFGQYEEECDICDCKENIHVHHIDGDQTNGSIENLIPLCQEHHNQVHAGSGGEKVEELHNKLPKTSTSTGNWVPVTFKMPKRQRDKIDDLAENERVNRSEMIRQLLNDSMESAEGVEKSELRKRNRDLEQNNELLSEKNKSKERLVSILIDELEHKQLVIDQLLT